MIRGALRRAVTFLGSASLATWLLVVVSVWSMVASFIPQDGDSAEKVAAWAAAHRGIDPMVRILGLHAAFSSPVFVLCALALAVSTCLCAWQRTKGALRRARQLRDAGAADAASLAAAHDLDIPCDPGMSEAQALTAADEALKRLGIRSKRRDDVLYAVSRPWSVWGSPVFHWGLVALIVVILGAGFERSDGLMGLAVGQAKPDVAQSYGTLHAGPLHGWFPSDRSIRVDAFDLDYQAGGVDRGAAPVVSVLDGAGRVVKTQRVYPNAPLQTGSVTIHPSDYGLSVTLDLIGKSGAVTGQAVQIVDFSPSAPEGTIPVASFAVSGAGGALLRGSVTVPLDRANGLFVKGLPKNRSVHVVVTGPDGTRFVDTTLRPGDAVPLPSGDRLGVASVGYYARLKVVDDHAIPFLYAALAFAMLGLTATAVARQQLVVVAVSRGGDGQRLVGRVRLWRNVTTDRAEIESELVAALGEDAKERVS